jgi:hypothetical protein
MTNFNFTDDDDVSVIGSDTLLDQLKSVIAKSVEREEIYLEVPERPNVLLRISPNITQHQLKSWRRNAGEDRKQGLDTVKFGCSVIGHTTTGIMFNNEIVTNSAGVAVTFASPEVLEMTNTSRPLPDCVQAFFGIEPHIEAAAVAIMEASGYGDLVDTVDPTKGSSEN